MTRRASSAAAALVVALLAAGTTGCASSGSRADTCSPARPYASRDIARAGDTVTVSATAVACRVHFVHDRKLTLTWRDSAEHEVPLGAVRATAAGGFEQDVRVPEGTAPETGSIVIGGFDAPCADTGSCAAYAADVDVVDGEPDFSGSARANEIAGVIAVHMMGALRRRPSYVQVSIVPDGVKIVLHSPTSSDEEEAVAERAFAAAQTAVEPDARSIAEAARLHVEFIQHDGASLTRLMQRISGDGTWQKANEVALSRWGPDPDTDSVRVFLQHYSDATAILLTERYGDAITVSPKDHGLVEPT